jgi:hypothetical protein
MLDGGFMRVFMIVYDNILKFNSDSLQVLVFLKANINFFKLVIYLVRIVNIYISIV